MLDFPEENQPTTGLDAEDFTDTLNKNGVGYLLEVRTEGVEDNVVATTGHFDDQVHHTKIDFGNPSEINDALNTNLSSEHCAVLHAGNGQQLTVVAQEGEFVTQQNGDAPIVHETKDDFQQVVEQFTLDNGDRDPEPSGDDDSDWDEDDLQP